MEQQRVTILFILFNEKKMATEESQMLGIDVALNKDNDITIDSNNDFVLVSGRNNISQAIYNRLTTTQGFFDRFSVYGSKLIKCYGKANEQNLLVYARMITYEALQQEPRIKSVKSVVAEFVGNNQIKLNISATLIDSINPYNFVYDFFIR